MENGILLRVQKDFNDFLECAETTGFIHAKTELPMYEIVFRKDKLDALLTTLTELNALIEALPDGLGDLMCLDIGHPHDKSRLDRAARLFHNAVTEPKS